MVTNWLNIHYDQFQGFGYHGLEMIRALSRTQAVVVPLAMEQMSWEGWMLEAAGVDLSLKTVVQAPPDKWPKRYIARLWGFCMYESDAPPVEWAEIINERAEALLVPSPWLVDVFKVQEVEVPIHVVNEGINTAHFPIMDRRGRLESERPYTFMCLGDRGRRKGHGIVWDAFFRAFPDNPDVRLIVKTAIRGLDFINDSGDPRVTIWRENALNMADVYGVTDVFVFPSRGEGWGLPPREAAATGAITIASNASGLKVGIDDWALPVECGTEMSDMPGGGLWFSPNVDQVVEWMRWCYENKEDAYETGIQHAEWLHANQTWEHAAKQFLEAVHA